MPGWSSFMKGSPLTLPMISELVLTPATRYNFIYINFEISLSDEMVPLIQQFREIETCVVCSAANMFQVQVFYSAQRAVLYPTTPLLDLELGICSGRISLLTTQKLAFPRETMKWHD